MDLRPSIVRILDSDGETAGTGFVLTEDGLTSAMETDWAKLGRCVEAGGPGTETIMKVVVFDDEDYGYAKEVGRRYADVPLYLQVGNDRPPGPEPEDRTEPNLGRLLDRYEWLAEKVVADGWNEATVLPQLHVLVWGNKRGV